MACFRQPKTTAERREAQEGWERGKRSIRNLPNAWDDIPKDHQRSWKKHRKTKHK